MRCVILTKRARHFLLSIVATNPDAMVPATFQLKSRRNKQQCFVMRGRDRGCTRGVYSPLLGDDKIISSEPIPELLETEFRIVVDRLGSLLSLHSSFNPNTE